MSLFGTNAQPKRLLVFHIGTHAVICAYISVETKQKNKIPEIIFSHTTPLGVTPELSISVLMNSMKQALKKSAAYAVSQKIGSPDKIVCFLEAPWYAMQFRTISMAKTAPFLVTEKVITDLIKKETELFDREVLVPSKNTANEAVLVEREMSAIRLNGYHVQSPIGQKVREISITLSMAISPRAVVDQVQDILAGEFHRGSVTFHTFGYAGATITRDLFISQAEFLFVDIGGDMTELVLVRDGTHSETVSFPGGIHSLTRNLSRSLNINLSEAQDLISLYLSGRQEDRLGKKIERILAPTITEWTRSLENALELMATRYGLPSTVALMTERAYVPLYTEAIMAESRTQHTLTGGPFTVIPLSDFSWRTYTTHTRPIHPRSAISALLISRRYQ
jgi:cell division ATPase FtsA